MSFKVKTILLLVILSLAPYVITMVFLGNAYRTDFEKRTQDSMQSRLRITVDRIDNSLSSLKNDMAFIASLDIMNDILTGDLDRRIFKLLLLKKEDLQLLGGFDVIDNKSIIIASSDVNRVGKKSKDNGFLDVAINSTFNNKKIGRLILHYEMANLNRYFTKEEHQTYRLIRSNQATETIKNVDALHIAKKLSKRPELTVMLEQDKKYAFAILDNFKRDFYIALIIGIILIATVAYSIASYIVKPILLLSSTAKSITKTHDFSQRVTVDRSDEIGALSRAFNSMISGMQKLVLQLKEESENKLKLAEEKNRTEMLQQLSTKLSRYLSPQIYESIFSGEQDVTLTSSRKKLTIFFSDIVDFTATTDQMESEDLTQLLNQYLREMTNIALEYGATIDKYIGDAIMIFFGDPNTKGVNEDARFCIEMAVKMQERVQELQTEWRTAGYTRPFSIRIGIHTGYCTVGNFGTDNRMDYTIIGSAVNLSSRIEGLAEPGAIYISEDTYLLIKKIFNCRPVSTVTPKGLNQPIQLYNVEINNSSTERLLVEDQGFQLSYDPEYLTEKSRTYLKNILADIEQKL